ncbi:nucleoside-diphosphatase [Mycena amicta]|nr:nucleoside-diphosphatase [Mycena amicta]
MPPSTGGDAWLTGRRFGIVVDAGSSGSRVQIYSWRDPRMLTIVKGSALAASLPKVEKGTRDGENWMSKVEPGISSYADHPETIADHLRPLLAHARNLVQPHLQHETPLFLLATAGMRLLPSEKQAAILKHTCNFLVQHSDFKIDSPSQAGPCGSSVRIITGEEEGLFGWIAVNYLMDGFQADQTTYGFLDMGGASTQIAFEPQSAHVDDQMSLIQVRLRLLGGEEIHHQVFVTTWLGYGTNQARERYVGKAINDHEQGRVEDGDDVVHDPCLPAELELMEHPVHLGPSSEHAKKTHRLLGTGSFEQCMNKTAPLLNKNTPCPDTPCLMNGVHVPTIDFSVSHFIGVSEYWYSSEHVFGLGGPYDFVQYERAASKFCSRSWSDILAEHGNSQHLHGGDGEVEKDGRIVEVGNWSDKVEVSRLQMQCFKAAWVANVLHDGIGMPRIIDKGGNNTTDGEKVAAQAESKGLGRARPTFQSVDTVGDIAISWTLGKMVQEASNEVTPLVKTTPPIVDPLEEPVNSNSPIKPIRPFWDLGAIEDRLENHLPPALTREELGFSPVMMLLYLLVMVIFLLITYPLWKRLRSVGLRALAGRDRKGVLLEEGNLRAQSGGGSSRRWLRRLSSMFMRSGTAGTPTSQRPTSIYLPPHLTNGTGTGPRSPNRSATLPPPAFGFASTTSRSPSPGPAFIEVGDADYAGEVTATANGNGLSSRSRNSSSKNLSSMVGHGAGKTRARVASGNGNGQAAYY